MESNEVYIPGMPARCNTRAPGNSTVQLRRHPSWRLGRQRAHPEYCELGYICILHLHVLLAAFSDHIYDESRTYENQKDYAYNLGKEKE